MNATRCCCIGGCHCGAVRYRVEISEVGGTALGRNCSICRKKGFAFDCGDRPSHLGAGCCCSDEVSMPDRCCQANLLPPLWRAVFVPTAIATNDCLCEPEYITALVGNVHTVDGVPLSEGSFFQPLQT